MKSISNDQQLYLFANGKELRPDADMMTVDAGFLI